MCNYLPPKRQLEGIETACASLPLWPSRTFSPQAGNRYARDTLTLWNSDTRVREWWVRFSFSRDLLFQHAAQQNSLRPAASARRQLHRRRVAARCHVACIIGYYVHRHTTSTCSTRRCADDGRPSRAHPRWTATGLQSEKRCQSVFAVCVQACLVNNLPSKKAGGGGS